MNKEKITPILCKNFETLNINHGFFTRNGGVSSKENFSLNCSFNSNDSKDNVLINRKLICNYHKLDIDNLKIVNQVHSNKIQIIENINHDVSNIKADALITKNPNIILGLLTADCAPVLIQDSYKKIIAAIHMGWKGTINNILQNTIKTLIDLGSDINSLKLVIGPCIGPESYEVGNDFYLKFTKIDITNKKFFQKTIANKFKFNLPQYIFHIAINMGIHINNISNTNNDTFKEKYNFFSYRRNFTLKLNDCGRMISTISMKNY